MANKTSSTVFVKQTVRFYTRTFSGNQVEAIAGQLGLNRQPTASQVEQWLDRVVEERLYDMGVDRHRPAQATTPEPSGSSGSFEPEGDPVPTVLATTQPGRKRLEWRAGTLPEGVDGDISASTLVSAFNDSEVWRGQKRPDPAARAARQKVGQKRGEVREVAIDMSWDALCEESEKESQANS